MSTSAPKARLVDALSGAKAPDTFFKALSEADSFCAELDTLRELQTRVQELTAERDELMFDLALTHAEFAQTSERLRAENADLADRLHSLRDAHRITLTELARARNERDDMRAEESR